MCHNISHVKRGFKGSPSNCISQEIREGIKPKFIYMSYFTWIKISGYILMNIKHLRVSTNYIAGMWVQANSEEEVNS